MELSGKVAVVTGASRGIGLAIATELAAAGARIVGVSRSPTPELDALVSRTQGRRVAADVATTEGCAAVVDAAQEIGRLDILVNNAGVTSDHLLIRLGDDAWDHVLDTNLGGVFRMSRAVLPMMSRQRDGAIVNIGSVTARMANPGQANYAAAKAGVEALTRTLAREMGRRNVRVNVVSPGFVETDMTRSLPSEVLTAATERIPLGRIGQVGDIAPIVRFLCGPGARWITGQTFVVDGGMST